MTTSNFIEIRHGPLRCTIGVEGALTREQFNALPTLTQAIHDLVAVFAAGNEEATS